ncbi:MAG: hypothetical protein ACJAVN_002154 [Roseivirga sp.]|jgi:hypothetical protein
MSFKQHTAIYLSVLFITLSSCGTPEAQQSEQVSDIDKFKTFAVDPLVKSSSIFDAIEEVEILGLEETAGSLLSFATSTNVTQDKVIFRNGNKDELYIYSKKGEFIDKINSQGDGPEEYGRLSSFWVNDNKIQIHDGPGTKINSYDLQGNLLTQNKLPEFYTSIRGYKDSYIADVSRTIVQDSLRFSIAFPELDSYSIPIKRQKKTSVIWLTSRFSRYEDNVLYTPTYGDTVYMIKDNAASPLLSVDFGEKWLWKDVDLYDNVQAQRQAMAPDGMVNMFMPIISKRKMLFTIVKRGNGLFLVDRISGGFKRFDLNKKGEGKYSLQAQNWDGDKAIFSIGSDQIGDFLMELGEEKAKFLGNASLKSIENSENPVLIWVKFK